MRILVYALNFSPEMTGAGKYTGEMVAHLAQRHQITVITTPPYYPTWALEPQYRRFQYFREHSENCEIIRCPLWLHKKMNFAKRLLHLGSFALSSLWPMLKKLMFSKPDLIFCVEPTFMVVPAASLLAMIFRVPLWVHVQDFELDAMLGLGNGKKSRLAKILLGLESFFLRKAQHYSSISPEMCKLLESKVQHQVHLFPNWVDTDHFAPNNKDPNLRQLWNYAQDDFIVMYSGNIGLKQGLDLLPEIVQQTAHNPHIKFLIIGDGVYLEELKKLLRFQVSVRFAPLQKMEDLPKILNMADLHLVLQKPEMSDLVLPSKLTAILAVGGHAIITAPTGSHLAKLVKENSGIATLCSPNDPNAVAQAILEAQKSKISESNDVARQYAIAQLSKDQILSKLGNLLNCIPDA